MKVLEVKKLLDSLGLSEEIKVRAGEILTDLEDEFDLSDQEAEQIIDLIKLEIKVANIQAETYDKVADAIDKFIDDVGCSVDAGNKQMDKLEGVVRDQLKKIVVK